MTNNIIIFFDKPSKIIKELKQKKIWVNWRFEEKENGKPTKIPFQPNGKKASSNDKSTWHAFEEVEAVRDKFNGIGLMFDGSIIGIDLDNVLVDGKIVDEKSKNLVDAWEGYIEVSPSGKGLHLLAFVEEEFVPKRKKFVTGEVTKSGAVAYEVYTTGRYFTFTGNVWDKSN